MGKVDSGIGFTGLLTIVFIVLKLIGKITWSWVWVLSPVWISGIILVLIMFFWLYHLLKTDDDIAED